MPEITKRRYISAEAAVAMTAAPLAPTSCAPSIVSIVRPVMSASIWHVTGESAPSPTSTEYPRTTSSL